MEESSKAALMTNWFTSAERTRVCLKYRLNITGEPDLTDFQNLSDPAI
jgi:hypothetical protein